MDLFIKIQNLSRKNTPLQRMFLLMTNSILFSGSALNLEHLKFLKFVNTSTQSKVINLLKNITRFIKSSCQFSNPFETELTADFTLEYK